MGDPGAHRHHMADAFVTGDEGRIGLDRPIALGGMQIGVADAAGGDLDQYLAGTRGGHLDFAEFQGFAKGGDDSGFHCFRHDESLMEA